MTEGRPVLGECYRLISAVDLRSVDSINRMTTLMSGGLSWVRRHPWLVGALLLLISVSGYALYLFQPHGYRNLERLESLANRCTSMGSSIAQVSDCFRRAGIEFSALPKAEEEYRVYFDGRGRITAHKGDIPMTAMTRSGATGPFPCGRADVQIVLVFGPDEKLRDRSVKRAYTCP